jgi:hypothetical protein
MELIQLYVRRVKQFSIIVSRDQNRWPLSIEEAGSEKKFCSAILLFIYSIKGASEWSGVEKRGTAVPPLPQSGRQE